MAPPSKTQAKEEARLALAVARHIDHLSSSAVVLPRLSELLKDPASPIERTIELIRLDSGMAVRVLQIANSAFYSPHGGNCASIEQAVTRVGLIKTYELAAIAVASELLTGDLGTYGIGADHLWLISMSTAVAASRVAAAAGLDPEVAYTTGLLHACGLVAVDSWARRHKPNLRILRAPFPLESAPQERQVIGCSNATVASEFLKARGLPSAICEPIRWQYAPGHAAGHERMATALFLAKWLRESALAKRDEDCPIPPERASFALLRLDPNDLMLHAEEVRLAAASANLLLAPAGTAR